MRAPLTLLLTGREAARAAAADRAKAAQARAETLMADKQYAKAMLVLDAILVESP